MVLAYFLVFFHRLAPGVLQKELVSDFNLSATAFGTLASMYFYAYMIMQLPVGMLADTLGARITVTAGMAVAAAGSFIFATASSQFMALAGRFIIGIGVSTVFVSILKIQTRWFKEREFATMSGLTLVVGNSGGILAQTPLALLVTYMSWRNIFMGVGLLCFAIAFFCYTLIRNNPTDLGYDEINEFSPDKNMESGFSMKTALHGILSEWKIWPIMIFYLFLNGSWLAFIGAWGVPYLENVYELGKGPASGFVIWAMAGMISGCFISGWVSDRMGKRKSPMLFLAILYTAIWGAIAFWNGGMPPIVLLRPLFFAMGLGFTSMILTLSVVKEINDPQYTGVAISVFNTAGFIGVPLVATLTGYIVDVTSSAGLLPLAQFHYAFMAVFLSLCAGTVLLVFVPETECHNIYKKKASNI